MTARFTLTRTTERIIGRTLGGCEKIFNSPDHVADHRPDGDGFTATVVRSSFHATADTPGGPHDHD